MEQKRLTESELLDYDIGSTKKFNGKEFEVVFDENIGDLIWKPVEKKNVYYNEGDWKENFLDKEYEGEFDINKAFSLLVEENENSQKEAIRYATYFAKKNNSEAKNFIICDICNKQDMFSKEVVNYAFTAFNLFFRNWLRNIVDKHYNKKAFPASLQKREDAVAYLWLYVISNLPNYDATKGVINTFFNERLLDVELISFDMQDKGLKMSKPTRMRMICIANADAELEDEGLPITIQNIFFKVKDKKAFKGAQATAIKNSIERYLTEKSIISLDSEEGAESSKGKSQDVFAEPESAYVKKEERESFARVYNTMLTKEQQDVFTMKFGIIVSGNNLLDIGSNKICSNDRICERLNITESELERINAEIINIFKNNIPREERVNKLLTGRDPIYTKDDDDFDLSQLLFDSIEDISFEDPDGKFTRIEDEK